MKTFKIQNYNKLQTFGNFQRQWRRFYTLRLMIFKKKERENSQGDVKKKQKMMTYLICPALGQ